MGWLKSEQAQFSTDASSMMQFPKIMQRNDGADHP